MFYTYIHFKKSNMMPFYVGKGSGKRIFSKQRSKQWHYVVNKHGFVAEIASKFKNENDAFEHERFLIWCFKSIGIELINATEGGEGLSGFNHSEQTKFKISFKNSGRKLTEDHKLKLSLAKLGSNHHNFGNHHSDKTKEKLSKSLFGRKFTDETKKKMSLAKIGKKPSKEALDKLSKSRTGTKWYTDGKTNIRLKPSDVVPFGFDLGRSNSMSDETKAKISNSMKIIKMKMMDVLNG